MKHITWFLLVISLAFGCGRDKKAWARKIDDLVQRAYACKDVACAKQVEKEIGTIIASDEDGHHLDEGEPEFLFGSAERIRNRVADLEHEVTLASKRAAAPLTALQVFETTVRGCMLAYGDLHGPSRADVEAVFAKVGATMPPDRVPKASGPGGLFWQDAFVDAFVTAMKDKVPVEDTIYAKVAADLCIVNFGYDAESAKKPTFYGPTIDQLETIMTALEQRDLVKDLVAAVRRAAPDAEVFALTKSTTTAIRRSLGVK